MFAAITNSFTVLASEYIDIEIEADQVQYLEVIIMNSSDEEIPVVIPEQIEVSAFVTVEALG